jgi:formylglycine-generating enzyme required for sulfatase activity
MTLGKKFQYRDFEYRLPKKTEWEKLAEFSTHVLNNNGKNEKGKYQLNCVNPLPNGDCMNAKYPDVTAPVKSYSKSLYGLNNLEECRVGKDAGYTKPTAWLGFRCVCVVKNKGNN